MEQWGELEPREVSPELQTMEVSFDTALRPKSLEEFIGQPTIKENLRIFLEAAKKMEEGGTIKALDSYDNVVDSSYLRAATKM